MQTCKAQGVGNNSTPLPRSENCSRPKEYKQNSNYSHERTLLAGFFKNLRFYYADVRRDFCSIVFFVHGVDRPLWHSKLNNSIAIMTIIMRGEGVFTFCFEGGSRRPLFLPESGPLSWDRFVPHHPHPPELLRCV